PCPGPGKVVHRINDRSPVVHGDPFQKRVYPLPPSNVIYQVKAPVYGMVRRKPFELLGGKDFLDLPAEGPVKPEPFGTHGILGKEEPSISKVPPQNLPLLEGEGFKLIPPRHI